MRFQPCKSSESRTRSAVSPLDGREHDPDSFGDDASEDSFDDEYQKEQRKVESGGDPADQGCGSERLQNERDERNQEPWKHAFRGSPFSEPAGSIPWRTSTPRSSRSSRRSSCGRSSRTASCRSAISVARLARAATPPAYPRPNGSGPCTASRTEIHCRKCRDRPHKGDRRRDTKAPTSLFPASPSSRARPFE